MPEQPGGGNGRCPLLALAGGQQHQQKINKDRFFPQFIPYGRQPTHINETGRSLSRFIRVIRANQRPHFTGSGTFAYDG
jgi:hypothetical protein